MIPTVKIHANSERGWRIINASSFDPEIHRMFGAEPVEQEDAEQPVKARLKPGRKPRPRLDGAGE